MGLGFALTLTTMCWAESEQAAVVINGGGCVVRDANGVEVAATEVHKTITNNKNGNVTLRCQAKDVPNDTGSAVKWDYNNTGGRRCGIDVNGVFAMTEDWQQTLSADGRATIVCHIKKSE
jgi:hypothetical protein